MASESIDLSRNMLGESASPYLLQHRSNPVHWQTWSAATLAAAVEVDRPILLSIGYAACHWCHVMAHESFEDESIAALMNELFVNIKIDREERPDVDQIYMAALHRMGEPGGWPLTMFLTPGGRPFWGGTYFPPISRFGRPGFDEVLKAVAKAYRENRAALEQSADELAEALRPQVPKAATTLTLDAFETLGLRLSETTDKINGGLPGAPKFPNAPLLELLWRSEPRQAKPFLFTLRRIIAGGIHDHLGGGFARYTVDERWLVPHFEKMLYDNAQILELLALAFATSPDPLFADAADRLVQWLDREMTIDGAFASSLDADSEGQERAFYVWTLPEIADVLGEEDTAFFARFYDIPAGGNWHDDHTGQNFTIINTLDKPAPTASEAAKLAIERRKLLERRSTRPRPGLDDKILADWNGMMIAALAIAGIAFARPEWVAQAERAFESVLDLLGHHEAGFLRLRYAGRAGRPTAPGTAGDYVMLLRAATFLAEARPARAGATLQIGEPLRVALERFHKGTDGIFRTAASDTDDLIHRPAPTTDEAIPNPNGVLVGTLLRLSILTGQDGHRKAADELLTALSGEAAAQAFAHASVWNGLHTRLTGAEILVAGPTEEAESMRQAALSLPHLARTIRILGPDDAPPPGHPTSSLLEASQGRTTALVCQGDRCSLPIYEPAELVENFNERAG